MTGFWGNQALVRDAEGGAAPGEADDAVDARSLMGFGGASLAEGERAESWS